MSQASNPVSVRIHRIPRLPVHSGASFQEEGFFTAPLSSSASLIDDRESPSFIGERVLFSVVVQNAGTTRIRIQTIDAVLSTEKNKSPLEAVYSNEAERQHKGGKNIDIEPNTCYSLRYNKLLYEVGKQSVRVRVLYNNSLMEFAASGEYSFSSIKPFDLVFSRIPLSDSSCLVNSTITNNLATCLTITRVALQTAQNSFQEDYNSFTEPQHIQPKCKFSHVSIVKGQVQKDVPLGSLAIHFTVPGHGVMGLNSTTIVVADAANNPLCGYYETDGDFACLQTKSITAVLSNTSNTVQVLTIEWLELKSPIQFVGECRFRKLIQPGKTVRIPLEVLPLMSGDCVLEAPVFKGKKDARRTDISFSSLPVHVQ
ncbi:hypothetical protein WA556_001249 [Blastocystis sp. ATCC 50177/Nand II]